MILDVERSKAQMARPTGTNSITKALADNNSDHCYAEDDLFFHLMAHVDKSIQNKLKKGEVDIDISKLLVKQRKSSNHR